MNHDRFQTKLSEFRDGVLSQEERGEILRHLSGCPSCVAELNDLERLSRAFFQAPPAPDAEDTEAFVASVMARLPAPVPVPLYAAAARRLWLPATGLAFAVFFLSLWLPRGESADPLSTAVASSEYTTGGLIAFASEDR